MEKQRILIIDDDPNIRKTLFDILKVKGYEPLTAKNGAEGLELFGQSSVNLVIIDLGLPDMSGLEVLGRVKAEHPSTEVIILTGNASIDSAIEATNKGAFSYLLKPYEIDKLILHVRRAVEKHDAEEKIVRQNLELEKINAQLGEKNTELANEIAEHKRTEKILQESEERYRSLFQNNHAVMLLIDPGTGEIVDANPAAASFYGYRPEDFPALKIMDINTLSAEELKAEMERARTERQSHFNFRHRLANGHIRDVEVYSGPINIKGRQLLYSIVHDITERKQAEEALRASEERFSQVAASAGEWIWEVDADGLYTYASPAVEKMLGYKPDELIGRMHFYDFFVPEEREQFKKSVLEAFAGKVIINSFANLNLHKNGSRVILETSGVPNLDEQGRLIGYRGTDTDITERRQMEEALRISEERYRIIMENVNLGISLLDVNHKIIMTNKFFAELFKKPAADFVGKYCFMEFEKREAICPHCPAVQAMASGKLAQVETEGVRDNGSRFDVLLRTAPTFTADGTVNGFVEVIEDITERKQAEKALLESEEKYRNIFENAVEGIFQSTPDGRTISVNPAFARVSGFSSPAEMINSIIDIQKQLYVHPEDRMKMMERLNSRDFVNDYETELRRRDGVIIWVSINARAVRDKNGNMMLLEGTITDITERKKTQDELQKKNLELARAYEELSKKQTTIIEQEKMASIGMLAAGIAHEIKNPLAIVLQGVDYLQTAVTDNSLMIEVVERMNKAILRADIIIKSLLSYSRQNTLLFTEQDIPVLIDESLVLIEHELRKKNLQVIKQYAPDLPLVTVDGNQIKQVIINLLLNGCDAMSQDGIFTISVRQIKDDGGRKLLEISIKDTGHGIPADKIHEIFDPFYTTKGVSNTGLGLYISKGIIDRHKGIIHAESKNEQGANFVIELPIPRET